MANQVELLEFTWEDVNFDVYYQIMTPPGNDLTRIRFISIELDDSSTDIKNCISSEMKAAIHSTIKDLHDE